MSSVGLKGQKPSTGFHNLDWTDGARTGLTLSAVGVFFIGRDFYQPAFLDSSLDWLISISLAFGGWIIFQLARTLSRWKSIKISLSAARSDRTPAQWRSITQGFREIFLYLSISLVGLSLLIWSVRTNSYVDWSLIEIVSDATGSDHSRQSAIVLSMLSLAFLPILVGSTLKARHEAKGNLFRDDAVSSTTAYVGIVLVSSMGMLAVWAGNQDSEISSTLAFYVTFGVMLMFVTFILWPHIARLLNIHSERLDASDNQPASAGVPQSLPATALSYVDSFLVRLIAPLSGATQKGPMVPHVLVLLVLGPLIAIGFFLPAPFGLMPVFLGMLIVLSLGRRWAWIEDDRETASRLLQTESEEIHIGFDNDLKDEAIAETHLEALCANADARTEGKKLHDPLIQGVQYKDVPVFQYRVWCLERLQEQRAAVSQNARDTLDTFLEENGALEPLIRLNAINSGYDTQRAVPFGTSISVFESVK